MRSKLLLLFIFLSSFTVANEIDLSRYEASFYSEHGEDGILAKIFQLITPSSRLCIDLGACDGIAASNTYLLRLQGWKSLLLDRAYEAPQYNLYKEYITAENIHSLFRRYAIPNDPDLLSIDILYNTFYIWKAIDKEYRPAVVVVAYNATHLPTEDKVVQYHPFFCGDDTNYYGASILALFRLGRSKGYSLVYAERTGNNLFFIRDDILQQCGLKFKHMNDVEKLYHSPTDGMGLNRGRREDSKNRSYVSSKEIE